MTLNGRNGHCVDTKEENGMTKELTAFAIRHVHGLRSCLSFTFIIMENLEDCDKPYINEGNVEGSFLCLENQQMMKPRTLTKLQCTSKSAL